MSERKFVEQPLVDALVAEGWHARLMEYRGRRGGPDIICGIHGRLFLVEVKKKGEKPRRNQIEEHKKWAAVDIEVLVFDNLEEALNELWLRAETL